MAMELNPADSKKMFRQVSEFLDREKDGIIHGFFTRLGGISKGIYSELNCGPGSGDDPENIRRNREKVAVLLKAETDNLLSLYQVHGPLCLAVDGAWKDQRPQADAMATAVPGLALSILTADCAPVLFFGRGKNGPVIGAAHAGWKGAVGGVLENTIRMMTETFGADLSTMKACIGPCIASVSYEVSHEFFNNVMLLDRESERRFHPSPKKGHFRFDLPGYCVDRLLRAGLENVLAEGSDTYPEENSFFSYRRTTHRGEKDYGRQISVIMITPK